MCRQSILCVFAASLMASGCSALYTNVHDPGYTAPSKVILKSIRCEIVTYLEANYQRSLEHERASRAFGLSYANKKFGYLDLDRWQYSAVELNYMDVLSAGASLGVDLKYPFGMAGSRTYHVGPTAGVNNTYVKDQTFVIPQYASLGPVASVADETLKLYYSDALVGDDAGYFCYRSLGPVKQSRAERIEDLQRLVDGAQPATHRFERIMVDGDITLAHWLQNSSQELSQAQRTSVPTGENILPAQITYSFQIEVKLGLDAKYTLVASTLNPLVPDVSAGADNTNKFSIYLNAAKSKAAIAAKVGQAYIGADEAKIVPQTQGVKSEVVPTK